MPSGADKALIWLAPTLLSEQAAMPTREVTWTYQRLISVLINLCLVGMQNDLTPAEEDEIRRENVWAF
jgi:hypothetical protein